MRNYDLRRTLSFSIAAHALFIVSIASFSTRDAIPARCLPNAKVRHPVSSRRRGGWSVLRSGNMDEYASSFLSRDTSREGEESFTHMIGIPFDGCHDVLLEMESIQKAILYHCPTLVHSCIVPDVIRMPLLYVDIGGTSVESRNELNDILKEEMEKVVLARTEEEEIEGEEIGGEGAANEEGIRPVMMEFKGLEIDGRKNEGLHMMGVEGEGTTRMRRLVSKLRTRFEEKGWKTRLPEDPSEEREEGSSWRPRIPFMRLPSDFEKLLPPLTLEGEELYEPGEMRTAEEGGNGISPLFWFKYLEDDFTPDRECGSRLREIAVYDRVGTDKGIHEKAFYVPSTRSKLPGGNEFLIKSEMRLEDYYVSRDENVDATAAANEYDGKITTDDFNTAIITDPNARTSHGSTVQPQSHSNQSQNQSKEITQTNNGRDAPTSSKVENNSSETVIKLKSYDPNKRTLAANSIPRQVTPLPPYPSNQHFVGLWQFYSKTYPSSPVETTLVPSAEDNIILRVDGSVAGGPSLDSQYNQKAAGGEWKMFRARWIGDDDRGPEEQTRLRIAMLIPPKKEELLVMEGKVTRIEMPGAGSFPVLPTESTSRPPSEEAMLHCEGEMWIENVRDKTARTKIGRFTVVKLKTPRPERLVITVPRPTKDFE